MTAPTPVIRRFESGGFGLDFGDGFPLWLPDMGAVRRFLTEEPNDRPTQTWSLRDRNTKT
jgi:hypothetical protein